MLIIILSPPAMGVVSLPWTIGKDRKVMGLSTLNTPWPSFAQNSMQWVASEGDRPTHGKRGRSDWSNGLGHGNLMAVVMAAAVAPSHENDGNRRVLVMVTIWMMRVVPARVIIGRRRRMRGTENARGPVHR